MKLKTLYLFIFLTSLLPFAKSQGAYNYMDEQIDTTKFFVGINLGAYFANSESARFYSGTPNVTPYGIDYILSNPRNQATFRNYFGNPPFRVVEYPNNPSYNTSLEIGLHAGYRINKIFSLFLDFNTTQLDYKQAFTIENKNYNNNKPGPNYEQIPIFGEENRFYINLGPQINFYSSGNSTAYLSAFANATNVNLKRNYIVIDNQEYEIFHQDIYQTAQRVGGTGYGGGGGLGFKFHLTNTILADLYYNFYFVEVNLNENFRSRSIQNALGVRILWTK